jgi:hypothetical protein
MKEGASRESVQPGSQRERSLTSGYFAGLGRRTGERFFASLRMTSNSSKSLQLGFLIYHVFAGDGIVLFEL